MVRKFNFYVVPTPIGNIGDITLRAIDILKEVDFIACEDTRVTQKLLNHYGIKTKCISYHKYNERERVEFFLRELSAGMTVALVSDAGTPMICDPGGVIIDELIKHGFSVSALPGACALTTFLSQIPRACEEFIFLGFISRSESRIKEVVKKYSGVNMVFYDSPERILNTLKSIKEARGDIIVTVGRELSKMFEEVKTGYISEISDYYKEEVRGEIVCMVYGEEDSKVADLDYKISLLKAKGFKDKEVSVILSTLYRLNKNELYKHIIDM